MGYTVKLQKVERPTNRSYYVNLPVVIAETLGLKKGDVLEWSVEDKTTLILRKLSEGVPAKNNMEKKKIKAKK